MNDTLKAGWGFPVNATKAHYFSYSETRSLCGKWMYSGPRHERDKQLQSLLCKDCDKRSRAMNGQYDESLATISQCGNYRYDLIRVWDHAKPACLFIMLNPSTADAMKDDPTIRRCVGFAKSWGYGWLVVVNLFAWRATNPADLYAPSGCIRPEAIGPDNDETIIEHAQACPLRVAAWGAHGKWSDRAQQLTANLIQAGMPLRCLGLTVHGQPKHPLYIRADAALVDFYGEGKSDAKV